MDLIEIETDLRKLTPGKKLILKCVSDKKLDLDGEHQVGLRIIQKGADTPKKTLLEIGRSQRLRRPCE